MRQQVSPGRLAVAFVSLFVFAVAASAQTARIFLADGSELSNQTISIDHKLPVLFVHGHGDPLNFQKNWQLPLTARNLPSFKDALEANSGLGIEPYYISFIDSNSRSITDDAIEIGDAIERILHRHDPDRSAENTPVKVVIIAYSQGTISTRQYLKSLQTQVAGMPAPRPTFRPVSEFIAIAPPNHGLGTRLFATTSSLSVKQLYNGQRPEGVVFHCGDSFNTTAATDYIEILNKRDSNDPHLIEDTQNLNQGQIYPGEAPGSRSLTAPHAAGTLYVTLFDADDRDLVGGDIASGDCVGRAVASNRAPDAVNVPVNGISEDGWETVLDPNSGFGFGNIAALLFTQAEKKGAAVHQNTVHTFGVMCQALYAAVHHTSPEGVSCSPVNVTVPGITDPVPVPIIPPPDRAAAMLTLDFSGSMSLSTGPSATRASVLKEAVELFVALWSAVSVPSDRLGATYFRTNVTRFPTSGDPMPLLSTGGQTIVDDLRNNQSPGDSTAMGGGLQRAIEALNGVAADTPIRRVILFTDGMQNVNPMVQNVGGHLVIDNESGRPNSNVPVATPTPIVLDSSLGVTPQQPRAIAIDTIGIGAGPTFVQRLAEIAAATNGHTKATVDIDLLRQFFVEELINALKGFSPQLVDYRRGAIAANSSTEAFAIEDRVHKLVLKTSWKRGDSLDFSVLKDGVEVSSAGRFITGDFYKIFVIDLPAKGIATRGNWQVRIKGKSGTAYETAAIVDGSAITFDSTLDLKQPRAGEPLDLVIRLTGAGKPVSGTARALVTLLSPTTTAGDIIAKNPPKELPAVEPGMSIAEQQLLALTQDPKSLALLKGRPRKLVLKATGKGEFRARLNTRVPGIYTAFITVEGSDPKLGQFRRTMTMTAAVPFANADRKMTSIVVSRVTGGPVRIVVTPRDAKGHLIGPGAASEFSMELANSRMVGARDLGNGSYELLFDDVQSGSDPIAKLRIAGKSFFTGKLSELPKKGK